MEMVVGQPYDGRNHVADENGSRQCSGTNGQARQSFEHLIAVTVKFIEMAEDPVK